MTNRSRVNKGTPAGGQFKADRKKAVAVPYHDYGTNMADVNEFIEQIKAITPKQIKAVEEQWEDRWAVDHASAWFSARTLAQDNGRETAWNIATYDVLEAATAAGCEQTADACRHAVAALITRDLIAPEQFDTLYGPWKNAMEQTTRQTR